MQASISAYLRLTECQAAMERTVRVAHSEKRRIDGEKTACAEVNYFCDRLA